MKIKHSENLLTLLQLRGELAKLVATDSQTYGTLLRNCKLDIRQLLVEIKAAEAELKAKVVENG